MRRNAGTHVWTLALRSSAEAPGVGRRVTGWIAVGVVTAAVAACHGGAPPAGQVLARVNGHDITSLDVAAESRASHTPVTPRTEPMLLERVVDRDLLAESAHQQRLDVTPSSPSDLTRLTQNWRAQLVVSHLLTGMTPPSSQSIKSYITTHPAMFAKRTIYQLVSLELQSSPSLGATLSHEADFEAAQILLKRLGIHVVQSGGTIDSAKVPSLLAQELDQTPNRRLIAVLGPGRTRLSQIIMRRLEPIGGDGALDLARSRMEEEAANVRVEAELSRLRQTSSIAYQAGRDPKAR